MLNDENTLNILKEVRLALDTEDNERLNKVKDQALVACSNPFELVINYIFLNQIGVHFDFGANVVKKGTKLYRIRDFRGDVDFSQASEWLPPPNKPQNRANKDGQEALYLGSSELVCFLETHLKPNQKYVIATYECIEDFDVGGFFTYSTEKPLLTQAEIIINAFFIAPSRSERNKEFFEFLDEYIGKVTLDDLSNINLIIDAKEEMKLPYRFAVLNQRDRFYELTNRISDAIALQYPNGIRYSSCYIPMETPGIACSEYNLALYSPAIDKVQFQTYAIKTFPPHGRGGLVLSDVNMAKTFLQVI